MAVLQAVLCAVWNVRTALRKAKTYGLAIAQNVIDFPPVIG